MIENGLEFVVFAISGAEVSVILYLKLPNHLFLHFLLHLSMEKIQIKPLQPEKRSKYLLRLNNDRKFARIWCFRVFLGRNYSFSVALNY